MSIDPTGQIPVPQPEPSIPLPGVPMPPQGMPYGQPAWPGQPMAGQYPGMPMYMPKPPSPMSDPKTLVEKLPMFAMIALIGFSAYGLFSAIAMFVIGGGLGSLADLAGAGGSISAPLILMGISNLIYGVAIGVVVFAILMSLKHYLDMKQAKYDAEAK